ncbi:Sigma intracellular receptor 2 [Seminavis robusta]|uniref:Sigma intracellular receptor 2 n=1 Tax=Seminavis robusta TaxID=568900 RepID=A0A9N8GZQ5_9STRA|nr:Sigma intracellular receptor 2 [Seminavis robusta]|eukprot:Sro7_g005980.1 Sigma intracellular receptor 2 (170) ;mRNA; f:111207-111809
MKAFTGVSRLVLLGFFGSHIIFTLCLDCQAVLPESLFPQALIDLGKYEVETFNDPLMGNARNLLWFQSMVCLELLFQLPYFFAALYYIGDASATSYPDGFRAACIAYGAHTSTTLIPILSTFWAADYNGTTQERVSLTAMYFPYLAIPAWLLWTAATDSSGAKTGQKSD